MIKHNLNKNFGFKFRVAHLIIYKYIFISIATFGFNFQSFSLINNYSESGNNKVVINQAPVFDSTDYSFSISEQTALGSSAGYVSASDGDGDPVTYSIAAGNTNNAFSINSATGSITVIKRLNHHTQNRYTLSVKASDSAGLSNEVVAVINVEAAFVNLEFDSITWSTVARQPYNIRESQGEVVGGKLYTFGGFDTGTIFRPTSRAYLFDPVLNTWTSIAAMPPMNGTNRGGVTHAGFTTDGTDIYFAGGYTSRNNGTGQLFGTREVWKYIVAENRYDSLPDLPIALAAGQLEYLNGKLHHISGQDSLRTKDLGNHYVLNLDSLALGWKQLALLPNPRQHAGSVVFKNKIYFIGGQHGHDTKLETQKDVHVYNPITNTWTKMADLPVPAGAKGRGHISSAAIVISNYIMVLGGETVHQTGRTNMVSGYTPATNTWVNMTPLPQNRYSGVAANLGNVIYYTGGSDFNTTFKGIPIQKVDSDHLYTFTGNGNWSDSTKWSNSRKPPLSVPAGYNIIINGHCILDVFQTIESGASLTVAAGKSLLIQDFLTVQ